MQVKCGKPEFPSNKLQSKSSYTFEAETRNEATAWLDALRESLEDTIIPLTFSAFFLNNLNPYQNISEISALLTLLPESNNSTAMVRHCNTLSVKILSIFILVKDL